MAKREYPIQEFQNLLNVYVSNGRFPWRHKIIKNEALDKLLVVEKDSRITFTAHGMENSEEIVTCSYSIADLFSVESWLHDFVNWKTHGNAWQKEWLPPIYDVGYSFQYMNMSTMTICQKMEYFLRSIDMS
jgi:hypothetical protein